MKNSISKRLTIAVTLFFLSITFDVNADFNFDTEIYEQKVRNTIVKFVKSNDFEGRLNEPVSIGQDDSGVIRIIDPGYHFYQYLVLTPKDKKVVDPNVVRQVKLKIPESCDKAVIITHGWIDKGVDDWPEDMAKAFRDKTKPDEWMSLYFDWENGAKVANPVDAAKYSRYVAGPRLAKAFLSLLGKKQKLKHVHLVGHSAGTWAITTAGQIISDKTGAQVHLTLLDAYLPLKWDENKLGYIKADKKPYVEHYYSRDLTLDMTETDLPGAHNVDITYVDQVIKTHEYPYKWYGATVRGKFRKRDYVIDKKIITKCKEIDYGFKRSLESSDEGFEKSLKLKKGNEAVVIPKPKKKKWYDVFGWFN